MRATVCVPASTSNLGAGFDCVGVAVDRWLRLTARLTPEAPEVAIERAGTLCALDLPPERDLLWAGFCAAARAAGRAAPRGEGVRFRADSDIPVGRGLGSSAAAVIAGAVAADNLLDLGLGEDALFAVAAGLEGHPDNAAAALRGGATLALPLPGGGYDIAALEVHPSLALVFAVPEFTVATAAARAALPGFVPHARAAAAAARAAALVAGLARSDRALLAAGLTDLLHVPFRHGLIPGYEAVTAAAIAAGAAGATLSGSGSSLVAVAPAERGPAVGAAMVAAWRRVGVAADHFHTPPGVAGYQVHSSVEV